ncbi:MAG: D-alanine--D-alanine ligase [Candidatus Buchananbacteria bacterium]
MSKNKIKVGVIFGGRSGEHEVSIVSAQSVLKFLDRSKYEAVPIGITKQGQWIAGQKAVEYLKAGIKKLPFKSILIPDPTENRLTNVSEKTLAPVTETQKPFTKVDVIFPVMHGTYGEDGCLQGLLEMANIPYVGCGVLGSAVGMDKIVQKQIFAQAKLPIVEYVYFLSSAWSKNRQQIIKNIENKLKYPVFTKPANTGSSVGIGKCHNRQELIRGINEAARYDRKVIVEQGIENITEIEVSVLGNDKPRVSALGEIIPSNEFYDYDAKYVDGKTQAVIPAKLSAELTKKIKAYAIEAFKVLDLSGLSRVDFLLSKDKKRIYLNEVNTLPGFTSISMYPKLWEAVGLSYSKLLNELIDLAIKRHQQKNQLLTSYQPKQDWYK